MKRYLPTRYEATYLFLDLKIVQYGNKIFVKTFLKEE